MGTTRIGGYKDKTSPATEYNIRSASITSRGRNAITNSNYTNALFPFVLIICIVDKILNENIAAATY